MRITYQCPVCELSNREEVVSGGRTIACPRGDWSRGVPVEDVEDGRPVRCLVCGCEDLWRQKDFPPQVGLTMVGLGALLSTIAWSFYLPLVAIGILMAFALADLLLYVLMPDVLVCYRCDSRHAQANLAADATPRFSLETAERYRQQNLRLEQAGHAGR